MTTGSSSSPYDRELIALVCSRDPKDSNKAWEKIYVDNYGKIKNLIKSLNGKPEDFSDIYHDSLMALMHNIEQQKFKYDSSISTYLYSICFNQCCRKYKLDARKLLAEKIFEENISIEGDYDAVRDILWNRVSSILATELREACREILVKFYFERQSMKQLQEYYNVSDEQVAKNKKLRCLKYLRRAVESAHINPEAMRP